MRNARPFCRCDIGKAVVDVVQAPDLVGPGRLEESMLHACGQSFLRAAADVEPERRVDPIRAFVIPRSPCEPQLEVRLPEANRRVPGDKRVQRVGHRAALLRLWLSTGTCFGRGPWPNSHDGCSRGALGACTRPACASRRRSEFFSTASFSTSWARDRSASRSFKCLKSLADGPPYLAFQL